MCKFLLGLTVPIPTLPSQSTTKGVLSEALSSLTRKGRPVAAPGVGLFWVTTKPLPKPPLVILIPSLILVALELLIIKPLPWPSFNILIAFPLEGTAAPEIDKYTRLEVLKLFIPYICRGSTDPPPKIKPEVLKPELNA